MCFALWYGTQQKSEMATNNILFFDTETSGLPSNYKAPCTDVTNWPRCVQLAWILCDSEGNEIQTSDSIIRPEGFTIDKEVSDIHKITNEIAVQKGIDLALVLANFIGAMQRASLLVAHNMDFDRNIVGAECVRKKVKLGRNIAKFCTMKDQRVIDFVAIEGYYGFKWPKLKELHEKLFGYDFDVVEGNAHNALKDVQITKKCYFELKKLGII